MQILVVVANTLLRMLKLPMEGCAEKGSSSTAVGRGLIDPKSMARALHMGVKADVPYKAIYT